MNRIRRKLISFIVATSSPIAFAAPTSLFNGENLDGWETYLGPRYSVEKKEFDGPHVGVNTDPRGVFSVVTIDGAPAIRISGEDWGSLTTDGAFEDYHLRLQVKWGERRWAPRENAPRDSGLLYHSVGPDAAGWFFWKRSQEFQIQDGDMGDYWEIGGVQIKAYALAESHGEETIYRYSLAGDLITFGADSEGGPRILKSRDAEFERGEWNTLDLYCIGQTSMHVVNGELVMVLRDSVESVGDGAHAPLTKGKIQLQSEGAEVYYRNISIEPIDRFPDLGVSE